MVSQVSVRGHLALGQPSTSRQECVTEEPVPSWQPVLGERHEWPGAHHLLPGTPPSSPRPHLPIAQGPGPGLSHVGLQGHFRSKSAGGEGAGVRSRPGVGQHQVQSKNRAGHSHEAGRSEWHSQGRAVPGRRRQAWPWPWADGAEEGGAAWSCGAGGVHWGPWADGP